jgi:hypothetical protein
MLKALRFCAAVGGLCGLLAGCSAPGPLRVMSASLADAATGDGWAAYRAALVRSVEQQKPDVVALQGVDASQAGDLRGALPGYAFVGVWSVDGRESGFGAWMGGRVGRASRFCAVRSGFRSLGGGISG